IYHVNATSQTAKITAVLENLGSSSATITFTHKALATPSTNYPVEGKLAVQQYYENASLPSSIAISAGGSALLDSALDSQSVASGLLLVHAIYEFTSTQPLRITSLILAST